MATSVEGGSEPRTSGEPDQLIVLFCTVPDEATAERLARGLLDARLAACVKLLTGVRSFYRWEGKVEVGVEVQLLIKTVRRQYPAIDTWIHEHHPYDVPELVALSASHAGGPYVEWALAQTR